MKLNTELKLVLLLGMMIANTTGFAQVGGTYRLSWNTLDGAGGTCIGENFALCGTVGQPEAGAPGVGGGFVLTGGFWTGLATEVGPPLHIASSGGNIILSWPASASGYHLQHCPDLAGRTWVSNAAPIFTLGEDKVVVEPANGVRFYRLIRP